MDSIISFLKQWDILGFVVAAIISLIIGSFYKWIENLFRMKRKQYNISRKTISRLVYDNRIDGDFSISVSYKGEFYGEPLTIVRVRLLNDGENDINYIRQCEKPISIEVINADIVDCFIEPSTKEIESSIIITGSNVFDLKWELLKKDEYIDIVIVAKGKDFEANQVKINCRAEGVGKIKSPEYHVWPQLWPMLLLFTLMAILSWFLMPARETFIPGIKENVFWTCVFIFMIPLGIITVLVQRIRWEKE